MRAFSSLVPSLSLLFRLFFFFFGLMLLTAGFGGVGFGGSNARLNASKLPGAGLASDLA
jgi:hypothetical protein